MTTARRQALVWVDHHEARIVRPLPESAEFETTAVTGDDGATHGRKHDGGHRHPVSSAFAERIALAVADCTALAVVGPSTAKSELMTQLRSRHHSLAERVAVVETLDRESDAQLAAHARQVFERLDQMHGIHVPQARD